MRVERGRNADHIMNRALPLLILFFLTGLVFYSLRKENTTSIARWEELLRDQDEALIYHGGESWKVKNGQIQDVFLDDARLQENILATAWYHAVHRRDPLLSLSGVDIEAFEAAVEEIRKMLVQNARFLPNIHERIAMQHLHPTEFFSLLPELERKRRELLASPSEQGVRAYHILLIEALESYLYETKRLDDFLSDSEIKALFFTTRASSLSMRKALRRLQKNVTETLSREAVRFSCYQGKETDLCKEPAYPSAESLTPNEHKAIFPSPEALRLVKIVSGIQQLDRDTLLLPQSGKLVQLTQESCGFMSPELFYYWEAKDIRTGLIAGKSDSVSNAGFLWTEPFAEHARIRSRANPLSEIFSQGTSLYHQNMSLYLCLDSGHDLSRLLTVLALQRHTQESPLGVSMLDDGRAVDVLQAEKGLAEALSPSDALSEKYISTILSLLKDTSYRTRLDSDVLQAMEERVDLWRNQSADLEKALANVLIANSRLAFYTHSSPELKGLFMTRSFPSIFFLPANSTLVHEKIFFSSSRIRQDELEAEDKTYRTSLQSLLRSFPFSFIEQQVRKQKLSEDMVIMRLFSTERKLPEIFFFATPPTISAYQPGLLDPILESLQIVFQGKDILLLKPLHPTDQEAWIPAAPIL